MEIVDILIKNANEIITLKGLNKPRIKNEMNNLSILEKGDIAIKNGYILDIGKNLEYKSEKIINAKGKIILPGFIDPHTHLVFAGSREFELEWKLKGYSYIDILKRGGGILYTVDETRKAKQNELINQSKNRLNNMLKNGTTTCEAKSGYGLNIESEIRILKTIKKLNEIHPIDIIPTFLGAHAIPKEYNSDEYFELIINEMIPKTKELARFCDVFCEKGVFTPEQSENILRTGKTYGLIPKIHADEIVDTGGAALSAKVGAISADHLLKSNKTGLKEMTKKNVVGILLPGTPFSLMMKEYANARKIIDLGVPVALATDLNPNCWIENMQFIIQLACLNMKMTPAEAICASTFNAACALGKQNEIGSLEKGKQADIIVLDVSNHLFITYNLGVNHVEKVIKKGIIFSN
jgi:imidazolonepropionase